MNEDERKRLQALQRAHEAKGNGITAGMATAFPKNPPPQGMAYSKNFARFHQQGRFAVQTRD